jgi:Sulfotransferase family
MSIQPVFVFSVSRSGSTLVQRVMAAHDGVATVSEPWLALPHAYSLRSRGIDAEYQHGGMVDAIADFCDTLPHGREDYVEELRASLLNLYGKAAGSEARYFVDKSPPYCFVAAEIITLFPEGKFVFLWRNPLSVIASIIETWEPWHPTMYRCELFAGLPRLISAYESNSSRAHSVRFEDLVSGEPGPWAALMEYVGIEFDPDALSRFSQVRLSGRMGDPTGVGRYTALSSEPAEKWRNTLANPLRREWCRRYLSYLGSGRLATMGYDRDRIVDQLNAQPARMDSLVPDVWRLVKDVAKEPLRVRTRNGRIDAPNVIRALLAA